MKVKKRKSHSKKISNLQRIEERIYFIRKYRVMTDSDLAELYGVTTKRLNEQVKRNAERFPPDFMFIVSGKEYDYLRSQIATSRWGGRRNLPYVLQSMVP